MIEGFGFTPLRTKGGHHIFGRPGMEELVNVQDVGGQAKPCQIRQFLRLVERYNIGMEDEP